MKRAATKYLIPQFMLAHFSHHVCTGVLIPLLPLLRDGFGLSYFQSGILVSSFSISYGLGQIPMAMLADRFSPRLLIVCGLMSISLTGIAAGCAPSFGLMVPCFIAMGLIGGTYHAPAAAFISQTLPAAKRGQALGLHIVGGSASFLMTPAMALGIATMLGSWRASFSILSLPAFLVGTILWLTTRRKEPSAATQRVDASIAKNNGNNPTETQLSNNVLPASWYQIARSVGIVVFLAIVLQIVFASVNSYLPLYMVDRHLVSPQWAGIVVSIIAGTGIIGAPLGGALSDRFGCKRIILWSLSLSGPLFLAVTRSPLGVPLILALFFYGMAMTIRMPTMESLIAEVAPVERRATALGIYFFLGMETAGIATPIVGRLIDYYGLDPVFTTLGIGLCLIAAMAVLFRKRL